jgi:hypothetical protein
MAFDRYRANPAFEAEVRAEEKFQNGMRRRTKEIAAVVQAVSPRHTGYYARHVKARGDRVVATDPFWHIVEFGSVNNRPYAPLRRGLRAAGVKFLRTPKPAAIHGPRRLRTRRRRRA